MKEWKEQPASMRKISKWICHPIWSIQWFKDSATTEIDTPVSSTNPETTTNSTFDTKMIT